MEQTDYSYYFKKRKWEWLDEWGVSSNAHCLSHAAELAKPREEQMEFTSRLR